MPVIVIGADTPTGAAIVPALEPASGELRIFVTDPEIGAAHRGIAKVAVGDVSDGTHVGGAATGAFCAVAIVAAATDDRERSFAADSSAVLAQWADGLGDAGIGRVIVVASEGELPDPDPLRTAAPEYFVVDVSGKSTAEVAAEVATLEGAR
jgi:hypothetical protein